MRFSCLRAMAAFSIFLYVSSSFAQPKVIVLPVLDDFVVIPLLEEPLLCPLPSLPDPPPSPLPPPEVILFDVLTDGVSTGEVKGGRFTTAGWEHVSGEDKIVWDLGESQTMEAGIIEFEFTGMSSNTKGGYLGSPGKERAYYFGLFNDPSGDKRKGGTNPAFIEIRYNWGSDYNAPGRGAIKFQAGDAGLICPNHEPYGTKQYGDWAPTYYYKHVVTFGGGLATLTIDGQFQAKIKYTDRPLAWRYLFVGDINYHGMSGPDNVTYRNVKVTKIK